MLIAPMGPEIYVVSPTDPPLARHMQQGLAHSLPICHTCRTSGASFGVGGWLVGTTDAMAHTCYLLLQSRRASSSAQLGCYKRGICSTPPRLAAIIRAHLAAACEARASTIECRTARPTAADLCGAPPLAYIPACLRTDQRALRAKAWLCLMLPCAQPQLPGLLQAAEKHKRLSVKPPREDIVLMDPDPNNNFNFDALQVGGEMGERPAGGCGKGAGKGAVAQRGLGKARTRAGTRTRQPSSWSGVARRVAGRAAINPCAGRCGGGRSGPPCLEHARTPGQMRAALPVRVPACCSCRLARGWSCWSA